MSFDELSTLIHQDLATPVLALALAGHGTNQEINSLPWVDAPRLEPVDKARKLLKRLQVLASKPGGVWEITPRGKLVSNLPAGTPSIWFFKPKVFRRALPETLVPGCPEISYRDQSDEGNQMTTGGLPGDFVTTFLSGLTCMVKAFMRSRFAAADFVTKTLRERQPLLESAMSSQSQVSMAAMTEPGATEPALKKNMAVLEAKMLAKRMKDAGVMDVVSYNTLIKAYVRHNLFDQAASLLLTMREHPTHVPNTVTYHELIGALLKTGKEIHRTRAWELVNEMKEDKVIPNKPLVSNLLRSLRPKSHSSEITRAMQLVDSIQHQVDEGLLCTVLEAGVRVGKASLVRSKLECFHGEKADCPVKITGAHSFGSLIKAYGFVKDVAGAWNCWREMSMQHLKPTNITLGCMVEAVASNGDVDGAHELIQRLLEDKETKSQVNAVIYGSILKGFSRKKHMDRVWEAFDEMKAHGITPTLMTFNAIMDGCVRNEEMSKVADLVQEMSVYNLVPNLITYSTMIKGFCATGDMQSAFAIFEQLQKGRESPDEVVYNTLLDGCLKAGMADEGQQLLEAMMAQGLAPSIYTLSVVVKLLANAKRLDKAFKLAEGASSRFRFRLGAQLQTALLQACISCRAFDRGARFYLKTHKDRLSADKKICQTIIRGLLSTGKAELAADLLRSLLGLNSTSEEVIRHRATQEIDEVLVAEVISALLERGNNLLEQGNNYRQAEQIYESLKTLKPRFTLDAELLKKIRGKEYYQ
eukprot:s10_g49.t1